MTLTVHPPHPDLAAPETFLSTREAQIIERYLVTQGRWASIHGFRSGGGLRVLYSQPRKETPNDVAAIPRGPRVYAEAIQVKEAWRILADDITAGGRDYLDVYGKTETHYLTGTTEASCGLDPFVLRGASLDVWVTNHSIWCRIDTYAEECAPPEMIDRACAGEQGLSWTDSRGFTFLFVPNGDGRSCQIDTIDWPEGRTEEESSYGHWPCTRTGDAPLAAGGNNLGLAIAKAIVAPEVEEICEPRAPQTLPSPLPPERP